MKATVLSRFVATFAVAVLLCTTVNARTTVTIVYDPYGEATLVNASMVGSNVAARLLAEEIYDALGLTRREYNKLVEFYLNELRYLDHNRFAAGFYTRLDREMNRILAYRDYLRWKNWTPAHPRMHAVTPTPVRRAPAYRPAPASKAPSRNVAPAPKAPARNAAPTPGNPGRPAVAPTPKTPSTKASAKVAPASSGKSATGSAPARRETSSRPASSSRSASSSNSERSASSAGGRSGGSTTYVPR